jgi:hypothetical protein
MNSKITLKIKEYNINFEDMDLNNLTLLTGQNGLGKSLINIFLWFCNFLNFCKYNKEIGELPKTLVQEYFSNIITQLISGIIMLHSNERRLNAYNGYIEIVFEKGIVKHVKYIHIDLDSSNFSKPYYLSTTTRLFDEHEKYLRLKTVLDEKQLLEYFKIYDIAFMEAVHLICKTGLNLEKINEYFTNFKKFQRIYLNESSTKYYVDYENVKNEVVSTKAVFLSNGEQAMLMMNIINLQVIN